MNGSLFDLRRLNAKTRTFEKLILEALFIDDCALMAHTEFALQLIVNKFAEASRLFGLTISLGKTEVLFQPSPLTPGRHLSISIEGTELKTVEEFKYLGSVSSRDGSLDKEINARICKASQALGRLWARVLNQHNIQQSTKLKVYKTIILTILLYGWAITDDNSLFMYEGTWGTSRYTNDSFQPLFLSEIPEQKLAEAHKKCGGAEYFSCIYDFVATDDKDLATSTKAATYRLQDITKIAGNVAPTLSGPALIEVILGQTTSVTFSAKDEDDVTTPTFTLIQPIMGFTYNETTQTAQFTPNSTNLQPIEDFLFADYCALNAGNEQEMQAEMDSLSSACNNFGLTISTKKTEVIYQPVPNKQYHKPQIMVNGQTLQAVETFTYLGSIDAETNNRISKASSAFGRLREKVWERRGISLKTKLKVYRAVVLTTLLYGCETWTVYRQHEKQINHFHLRCLHNILHIRWQDKVPYTKVLKQADIPSAITIMRKAQLRWAGHVSRMHDNRIPKQILYGELCYSKHTAGGQRKRFKDRLKVSLKDFNISTESCELLASNRPSWRHLITKGAYTAEERISRQAEQKRATRKARATSTTTTTPNHFCPTCGRGFFTRIGLISHLRTHTTISTAN
ncbi:hypothetical protein ACOMHN_020048 [Nucella lapillus]